MYGGTEEKSKCVVTRGIGTTEDESIVFYVHLGNQGYEIEVHRYETIVWGNTK